MKIYICILSITSWVLQVSDGKPPQGHKHGQQGSDGNAIYAQVSKPPGRGHGHGHGHGHSHSHCPCGPLGEENEIIYADIKHPPPGGPIYENIGHGGHHRTQPGENDPETLYSEVAGPGRGGCHGGGHRGGGRYGGGGYGGGNEIGDPDEDNEPTHDLLPFQCTGGGRHGRPPPLPPRPPNGHPDPHRHHHQNQLYRRNACRR